MYNKFVVIKYSYNQTTGSYSLTPETITDIYDVQVSQAARDKKDTFNFKINNNRNSQNWTFKAQDQVNIHMCLNGASASESNMIMNGMVKKVSEDMTAKKNALRIEGVSFGEICTTALVFYDPKNETQNVMEYLYNCLTKGVQVWNSKLTSSTPNAFMITWNSDNPAVKSNGSAFPVFTQAGAKIRDYYKSFNKVLNDYLTDAYTGDGTYYWYVNNAKELCIRKRKSTTSPLYNWSEGVNFKTGKTSINTEDIKNFIVVKCGLDLDGNPVSTRYDDFVSRAKNGFRYYMLVDLNITKNLIASDSTLANDQLREAARTIGYKKGEEYAKLHNNGYFSIQIVTQPSVTYGLGDRIDITIPSYANYNESSGTSLANKRMIITDIQYTLDSVLFTLEEEGSL